MIGEDCDWLSLFRVIRDWLELLRVVSSLCCFPGEVYEAGTGRDRASVGLHRQAGHQHVWQVPGGQHRGLGGGLLPHLLGPSQHPGPLCGEWGLRIRP